MRALGRAGEQLARSRSRRRALATVAIASFLRLTSAREGVERAVAEIEQSELVAHQPPAALAEQSRRASTCPRPIRRSSAAPAPRARRSPRGAAEWRRWPSAICRFIAHLGGEQPMRQRQRHARRGAYSRPRSRPRGAASAARAWSATRRTVKSAKASGRGITGIQPPQRGDRAAPGRADAEGDRPDRKVDAVPHARRTRPAASSSASRAASSVGAAVTEVEPRRHPASTPRASSAPPTAPPASAARAGRGNGSCPRGGGRTASGRRSSTRSSALGGFGNVKGAGHSPRPAQRGICSEA